MAFDLCKSFALSTILTAAVASTATAAARSISIPPAAMAATDSAFNGGASVILPKSGQPSVSMTFVLPSDYVNDTPVNIRLYMITGEPATCQSQIVVSFSSRRRGNRGQITNQGVAPRVSDIVDFRPNVTALQVYQMVPPPSGLAFVGQRAGDLVRIVFERSTSSASDTCTGSALVLGAEVRYQGH